MTPVMNYCGWQIYIQVSKKKTIYFLSIHLNSWIMLPESHHTKQKIETDSKDKGKSLNFN